MLSPLLFASTVDVMTENARGLMNKVFYEDDLISVNKSIANLKEKFLK